MVIRLFNSILLRKPCDCLVVMESVFNYGNNNMCTKHKVTKHTHAHTHFINIPHYRYKSWIIVLVIILIVPYGLLIVETDINLNWVLLSGQVFTSPFLVPIFMTITWSKATAKGIVTGKMHCKLSAIFKDMF